MENDNSRLDAGISSEDLEDFVMGNKKPIKNLQINEEQIDKMKIDFDEIDQKKEISSQNQEVEKKSIGAAIAEISKKYNMSESTIASRLKKYDSIVEESYKITEQRELTETDISKALDFKQMNDEQRVIKMAVAKITERALESILNDSTIPVMKKNERYLDEFYHQFLLDTHAVISSWSELSKDSPERILKNEHLVKYFDTYDIDVVQLDLDVFRKMLCGENGFDNYLKLLEIYYRDDPEHDVFLKIRGFLDRSGMSVNADRFFLM